MAQTGKLIEQQQDEALWNGLRQVASLPTWLAAARDADRVCAELLSAVPEFRAARWELKDCDVGHIRYKTDFWTALYQLIVRKPGDSANTTISLQGRIFPPGEVTGSHAQVEGSLGMDGWLIRLPALNLELRAREPETILAALKSLTDPEESRQLLEESIRADSPTYHDLRIQTCTPNVVRYKPGSRCTVVYRLEYDPRLRHQKWPELVVAKTYRGEKGKNAYDSMAALWNSSLGTGQVVKVAEPLAYLSEIRVLVQGPVLEEQTLKDLLFTAVQSRSPDIIAEADRFMRKTAAGLAALHNSEVKLGREWVWADEMAEVQNQVDRLAVALPELKMAAAPLLERLNRLAAATPPDAFIPSHGSFRPAQVLLHQGEIGFIDFDSFCQSEPANDLALFLGTLFSIGLTPMDLDQPGKVRKALDPATRQERFNLLLNMHNQFLEEYQRNHPVSYQRVILWEALDIFMFVLHGWTKIKVGEIDDIVYLLERFLAAHGILESR